MRNAAVVIGALVLMAGCTAGSAASTEQSAAPVAVRLADVVETELVQPVVVTGTVGAKEELALAFKVGGVVARIDVDAGQAVRAGQTLAMLDLVEIDAAVSRAESGAARAEREHERARRLHADSVVPLAQLQDAETAAQMARADLDAARFNRRHAVIIAPADGIVLQRRAEPGELIGPGAPVLVLASRARGTVLRAGLADRDAVRVRRGDVALVRFAALPDRTFDGRIVEIGAAADPVTGTIPVEIALPAGGTLFSGLVGTAEIRPAASTPARLVPVEAVLEADGASATIFTLADDGASAERRTVRVARIAGDHVVITAGLDDVREVITDGAAYLVHGSSVRVIR